MGRDYLLRKNVIIVYLSIELDILFEESSFILH